MTRPKGSKNKPRPSPIKNPLASLNPEVADPEPETKSDYGAPSNPEPELIPVEVEGHAPEPKSLGARLADKLKSSIEDRQENPEPELSESARKSREWRARKNGTGTSKEREEVANLILTIFVLGVAAIDAPETIKPERDELAVVANNITSILARHNLLLGKLSGDALDVVGIIAVCAGWYSRVAPELRRLRGSREGGPGGGGPGPGPAPAAPSGGQSVVSQISAVDASTGAWLNNQLQTPGRSE